jgi:hypothetical protein
MDLKLTGKIALVTRSTAAKSGMLTKVFFSAQSSRLDWRDTDCRWHSRDQPRFYLSAGEN